jgi:hypothetical protein
MDTTDAELNRVLEAESYLDHFILGRWTGNRKYFAPNLLKLPYKPYTFRAKKAKSKKKRRKDYAFKRQLLYPDRKQNTKYLQTNWGYSARNCHHWLHSNPSYWLHRINSW